MMAHDHVAMAALNQSSRFEYARDARRRNLIGIYIPASAAFAGDLKNKPWQTEQEAEQYFVWRLNLHSCSALTHIIESCVEQYVDGEIERLRAIVDVCEKLSHEWSGGDANDKVATTPQGLRVILSRLELRHQTELRKRLVTEEHNLAYVDSFEADLFLPLRLAINVLKDRLNIPEDAVWMVCLDEVEYLTELHHRILNTQIRSASGDLVFKIATMPFAHHTLATNFGDPVREGNDFEYVPVDNEAIDSRGSQAESEFLKFARELFAHRVEARSPELRRLSLRDLLGSAVLLEDKRVSTAEDREEFMRLLRRHANAATIARAERLQHTEKFKNEIVRKMNGALHLRDAILSSNGNSKLRIYSGELMVVRCADGNPRRLMRIINSLMQRVSVNAESGALVLPIDSRVQNEVLERIARDTLNRTQSEPPHGDVTATYLTAVGNYMRWAFTSSPRRIGTDQVTSIEIHEEDGSIAQQFIKQAIQLSLMIPAKGVSLKTGNDLCVGEFHLAFLFAPLFRILPRRNESIRLPRILSHSEAVSPQTNQRSLLDL